MRTLILVAALLVLASGTVATYSSADEPGVGIQGPSLTARSARPAYKQRRYDRSLAAFVTPELVRVA